MKVKDVMTPAVYTCSPDQTLHRAAEILWRHDCGCVPIVDADGIVRAMLTDRDICMGAYMCGRPLSELRIAESMSAGIVTCQPEDDIDEAVLAMSRHQVRRLPVVDDAGRIQGILSLNDMANALGRIAGDGASHVAAETLRALTAVSRHRSGPGAPELRDVEVKAQPRRSGRSRAAAKTGGRKLRRNRS
jgi:CBS domain-containing protein